MINEFRQCNGGDWEAQADSAHSRNPTIASRSPWVQRAIGIIAVAFLGFSAFSNQSTPVNSDPFSGVTVAGDPVPSYRADLIDDILDLIDDILGGGDDDEEGSGGG